MYDDLLGKRTTQEDSPKPIGFGFCNLCGYCEDFNKWKAYTNGDGWCFSKDNKVPVSDNKRIVNFYDKCCENFKEID